MRPLTAKGGITGTDLPRFRSRGHLTTVRVSIKLYDEDIKAMDKLCKTLNMTRSEWICWQVNRSLGNE